MSDKAFEITLTFSSLLWISPPQVLLSFSLSNRPSRLRMRQPITGPGSVVVDVGDASLRLFYTISAGVFVDVTLPDNDWRERRVLQPISGQSGEVITHVATSWPVLAWSGVLA